MRRSDTGLIELYAGDAGRPHDPRHPHPLPPGTVETLLRTAADPAHSVDVWVIDGSRLGHAEVMGILKLERMDRQQSEIRFWVAPAFWNAGIATAAVEALLAANPHGAACLRRGFPGQSRLGAGADQRGVRLSGRRRGLLRRPRRDRAHLDLQPADGGLTRARARPGDGPGARWVAHRRGTGLSPQPLERRGNAVSPHLTARKRPAP